MQLMWLSGPTGQVKSVSVTARNILIAAGGLAMALLLLGFVLNWVGLRVAVEYNPDLARSLGGVTTEAEQLRMEAVKPIQFLNHCQLRCRVRVLRRRRATFRNLPPPVK